MKPLPHPLQIMRAPTKNKSMKKLSTFLILSFAFVSFFANAKEPVNLAVVKQELIRYHDSGQYEKDIASVINNATHYLSARLAHPLHNEKKPAIVLDIDETSLSNYQSITELNFGGTLEEIRQAEMKGNDPVIAATLKLYQFAKTHGVAVFFITGRHEDELASTTANLQKAGYANWDGLILKPQQYAGKSASVYKTAIRKELTDKGYDIILNIGDQKSDVIGGYADKSFKLPNPYYFIP